MLYTYNDIHIDKIKKFTLTKIIERDKKDKNKYREVPSYKDQIENYLNRLSILIKDYFPLHSAIYKISKEYFNVVIVEKISEDDVEKYNKDELIFVNQLRNGWKRN